MPNSFNILNDHAQFVLRFFFFFFHFAPELIEGESFYTVEPEHLEILGYFTHQTLEWQLFDEKLDTLLVTMNLPESHCIRIVVTLFLQICVSIIFIM